MGEAKRGSGGGRRGRGGAAASGCEGRIPVYESTSQNKKGGGKVIAVVWYRDGMCLVSQSDASREPVPFQVLVIDV